MMYWSSASVDYRDNTRKACEQPLRTKHVNITKCTDNHVYYNVLDTLCFKQQVDNQDYLNGLFLFYYDLSLNKQCTYQTQALAIASFQFRWSIVPFKCAPVQHTCSHKPGFYFPFALADALKLSFIANHVHRYFIRHKYFAVILINIYSLT